MKKIAIVVATLFILSGCSLFSDSSGGGESGGSAGGASPEVSAAIKEAEEAIKKSASVGGEWRDTGKMIKKAEELLKEGKNKEAAEMAEAAEIEAMLGYMQATSQTADNLHI